MAVRAIGQAPKADGSRCPLGHLAMMWLQEMGAPGNSWKNRWLGIASFIFSREVILIVFGV